MIATDHAELFAALALQHLSGLAPADILSLFRTLGSFTAVLAVDPAVLPSSVPIKIRRALEAYQRSPATVDCAVEVTLEQCQKKEIQILPLGSDHFPPLLGEISRPPTLLFVKGDITLLSLPQIAVVGSRHATKGGQQNASEFSKLLAANGFVITSGLALGIDGAAHLGALNGGKTVAVTGTGVDITYPRAHRDLRQRILDEGGAVVSEFLPGTPPLASNFPRRNRIISGLSLGVLVVEAAIKSGSLITARYALEQGREVFAIPGSIHNAASKGCHQLIKQGATLVEKASDIVEQLGGMLTYFEPSCTTNAPNPLSAAQDQLLKAIGHDPTDTDMLISRTGLDVVLVSQQLVELELSGWIEIRAGRVLRLR